MSARIIFFDVETRKWAADLHEDHNTGWDLLRRGKGGASAICLYDTRDRWSYMYDDQTIQAAARHLEKADLIVGFSCRDFDIPCVEGILGRKLAIPQVYDIYTEVIKASAERSVVGRKGDFTLNSVCKRNLGRGKIDHGGNAKRLAETGQWAKLYNYCLDDVHLTRDLFARICRDGGLKNLNGTFINLPPIPEWIVATMAQEKA